MSSIYKPISPAAEGAVPPDQRPSRNISLLLVLLAATAPAVFALVSDNVWEDFFITYRCSLNLLEGNGLVYEAGRRLHVFTSPLGVLLPAGFAKLLGTADPHAVMHAFRVFSCFVLAGAWALAAGRLAGLWATLVTAGFWLFDAKLAAFSTNGMETALLVLFVMMAWRALLDARMVLAGVALAGAMWTRPDGFVFVGAVAAGVWLFPAGARPGWRGWFVMAGVAGLLYAPWFFWAWAYYGTPVPNTIQAKGTHVLSADSLRSLATYPWRYLFGRSTVHDAFLPPYFFFGGWPGWMEWFGRILAVAAAAVAVWPRCPRGARIAGLAFILGGAYLTVTTRAPWYFPTWQVLAYIAIGGGVATLAAMPGLRPWGRRLLLAGVTVLIAGQAWLFVAVTVQMREQQRLIEWGLRAPLGRMLAEKSAGKNETVFLEPLGYIGFFSKLSMRDTPGLCAPEVIRLRRAGTLSMSGLAVALQTDWVILRGIEFLRLSPAERAELEASYRLWMVVDERAKVEQVPWLPGRDFLMFDAYYSVWRRRVPVSPP